MKTNNFITKANKKAYKEIRRIETASNMMEVENAISNALLKTFGLYNIGLIKIAMRDYKEDGRFLKNYGCHTYGQNFPLLKTIRNFNFDTNKAVVKEYLISFIPERMKKSEMYKKLTSKLDHTNLGAYGMVMLYNIY